MKYAVVIPARYQSSRFPGKPLIDILGKSMIQRVWERCCTAVGQDKVYVATDSDKIQSAAEQFGAQVIMTSSNCLTGTDRLAEANQQLGCDFVINVQGDEPLIEPNDILSVIKEYQRQPETVINAMCPITAEEEFRSFTVPKVVASKTGNLLYMSRSPIPVSKTNEFSFGFKQVCIYAFSKAHLEFFASHQQKTAIEQVEDIEILRFLENDISVQMIEVASSSIAVDVPSDVDRVIKALN
ncbi:3-deoxy-manno-octulosonate cytidylyltransferase [Shewanella sp. Choline-02u-19]|jgi:3-deoxy-manno-octulosonate cytidylyltransferase (CMP-KDO synthetase)|uniref:3-deoxy-manno-octulosonate cytidylyltransferase n=1 Tax=unclassified Shewanella TaxID=196818 RepID=UPI000C345C5E|nr:MULTISPECIES: 3-deoxy-manno-octulosonate cytidylyltransferase [unclassified Shewanella]PKG72930.1 3-deoxy-manno-octulosonate cytidylyltransferase [Shewanella sp. GutCb]PKH58252.1 3-deoxy-manno-octulosonate cytidylyltransferase [Shewanella sp. Bg11-22]PKI29485.1 3-deoxy-manno-octulosonate cytidylyltransferase [Shewanella sp. Choline-02u-19]